MDGLNGMELFKMINNDEELLKHFGGIFAVDQLTFDIEKSVYYICNTDIYRNEGKHWVVVYSREKSSVVDYFDSLGKKPNENFMSFMKGKNIWYNTKRVQGYISNTCGYHCIYFLYKRLRGYDFEIIMSDYNTSYEINDKLVVDFVSNRLDGS